MTEVHGHECLNDDEFCKRVQTECCGAEVWECQTKRTPDGGDFDHGWMVGCGYGYGCNTEQARMDELAEAARRGTFMDDSYLRP